MSLKKAFAAAGLGLTMLLPMTAMAAPSPFQAAQQMADQTANEAGVKSGKTLPQFIGQIINIVLTFLGLVFLLLVLYAGFLWMTAGGDEKAVGKAKDIIKQAIVGLIVIVAGYAISNFVLGSLYNISQ